MKKFFLCVLFLFLFLFGTSVQTQAQDSEEKIIPSSWLVFQPKKLPFVPFDNTDYKKMYETSTGVSYIFL